MLEKTEITLKDIAKTARNASLNLPSLKTDIKNSVLMKIADELTSCYRQIQDANNKDLDTAKTMVSSGELSESLYKRLALTESKFKEMVQGVRDVAKLDDPVGKVLFQSELDDDLILKKISCPIGVIGVIFESRPDVVVQISSLAIKSSNAVILKGGSEAINTNLELVKIINKVLKETGEFPEGVINLIMKREEVKAMLDLDDYIDLIIPRGSNAFVQYIQNNTRIPVLGHADGICHIYIDEKVDPEIALRVCLDSKTDYPAACNAVETLLVHKRTITSILSEIVDTLHNAGVEIRATPAIIEKLKKYPLKIATEEDWKTEYTDIILSIKEVDSLEDAINHINTYGSGHTDCILTDIKENAEYFMNNVDSAGVYWNASTRFADGFRYGFGAEVGISTNKTHARGPVGLDGLMIYKYKLYGRGQVAAEYSKGIKNFKHRIQKI